MTRNLISVSHNADQKIPSKGEDEAGGIGDNPKVSWSDFTQATTCHGIRFIFTRGAHIWRR